MPRQYGYAGKIMRVDLSSGSITTTSTMDYANRFLGGRGIGTKIYWDEVSPEVKAFDAENRLIFVTGPATGIPPAGPRWQIYGKSPATVPDKFCYTNLGGKGWGAQLKFAGFDGLVIQGKSEKPVYLFIRDGTAEIRDASALWGKGSVEVREILKRELGNQVRIVATGPAGDKMVAFANLLADGDASGSSGFGAVMGSKKLKAIAVVGSGNLVPANRQKLGELTKHIQWLLGDEPRLDPVVVVPPGFKFDPCFACVGCRMRGSYQAKDGTKGKYFCAGAFFYQEWAKLYYGEGWNEASFFANRLCDQYGLDVWPIVTMMLWMVRCAAEGILTEENTGIPLSRMGSLEFIESLVKKIALREGFGDVLAQGPIRAADSLGGSAKNLMADLVSDSIGHMPMFCPRLVLSTGLLYATESRQPMPQITDIAGRLVSLWVKWAKNVPGEYVSSDVMRGIAKRFWGSELGADFSTYQGKAMAAKKVQDRAIANECVILCLYIFPIQHSPSTKDYVGDPSVESKILSAVTGEEIGEEELYAIGERVFNLHRAVMAREGHRGRESDKLSEFYHTQPLEFEWGDAECLVPGKDGEIISRKGEVLDREKFERMKDEFYALRGWDVATGLQTKAKLQELGLQDIAAELETRGLVV